MRGPLRSFLIFIFQVFQDVAHCTTALIDEQSDCMASIYMRLGLAKDDESRMEDYKKGGEHSRKLVNLTLCELL